MTGTINTQSRNYNTLHIPSTEEFHRYAQNLLNETDFCTYYPSGEEARKISSSLRWTERNANWNHKEREEL